VRVSLAFSSKVRRPSCSAISAPMATKLLVPLKIRWEVEAENPRA
jgi:hypothetical protein